MSERHVSEPVERCQLDLGRVAAVRLELLGVEPELLGQAQAISLADGLGGIGERPMLALREPSLGPVFGIKGGGTGGGRAQLAPMELINLYFTGDIHAMARRTTCSRPSSSLTYCTANFTVTPLVSGADALCRPGPA